MTEAEQRFIEAEPCDRDAIEALRQERQQRKLKAQKWALTVKPQDSGSSKGEQ